ncbi:MAG: hypothetical protein RLZZ298_53 [Pseudomonadota bacterium]
MPCLHLDGWQRKDKKTDMDEQAGIRRAQSGAADARDAVCEFHAAVVQPDIALVIFFCSSAYDLNVLAEEMGRLFAGVLVIGCTTAGEIGPAGYLEYSLSGASFPASDFKVVSGCLEQLQQFSIDAGQTFTQELLQRLEKKAPSAGSDNSFGLLLIDGLSVREEPVTRSLQSTLGRIPMVGASAGDGTDFGRTHVYSEGRFRTDCAVVVLLYTPLPFKLFDTHHFVATDERLVVTQSDSANRVVKEINGLPAAQEYARILGVDAHHLNPGHFSASPVVVLIDGVSYVRSIQKTNPDGSLTFYCAIENGVILRVAKGVNLLENLEETFAQIHAEIGVPQIVIGCDCLLRRLEIYQSPDKDHVVELLLQNNTTGLGSYGEQFRGVHLNQTFAGIAIGSGSTDRVLRSATVRQISWGQGVTTDKKLSGSGEDVQAKGGESARLNRIIQALMDRIENSTSVQRSDFSLFQTSIMLEDQVRSRTAELERAVRENEKINRALRESEEKFRGLANQSLIGIAIVEDERISYSNEKFNEIFGYSAEEIRTLSVFDTFVENERDLFAESMHKLLNGKTGRLDFIFHGRRKDGAVIKIEIQSSTMRISGKLALIGLVNDVTERIRVEREVKALQAELREQSTHDALTGLYNRRYLEESLERELIMAERQGHPVSVIIGDLDHFKAINDHYGHLGGDEVLRIFGALMKRHSRGSDIYCRYGGEEFLLVLPQMEKFNAFERAEQLRAAMARTPVTYGVSRIAVTASFGVATYPLDGKTRDALINAADHALYAAKAAGRNRVSSYSESVGSL